MNTLLQFLSVDDALVQSWTFMCFAAIAHAEGVQAKQASSTSSQQSPRLDISTWNTIWTHAMRRSTVPAVSRAACHAAHALLLHSKVLLTPQRVFEELETFAKDLDVQGPPFPYDAVCVFLVLCMQVASRDVRLYRMQFEEKVLTWFTDAWRPSGFSRSKMAPHTVEDLVTLLASICGVPKSAHLLSSFVLPDSPIVHATVEQYDLVVIRDFLLHTQLPKHSSAQARFAKALSDSPTSVLSQGPIGDRDLVQPRPRERRASAYLLKSLEDTLREWESSRTLTNRPTAAKARSSLDLAIIAVFFEAILLTNGTSSNRRVLQAACKILRVITPMVADRRWTVDERLLIAKACEPLIMAEVSESLVPRWVAFLPPGPNSGIRSDLLTPAKQRSQQTSGCRVSARRFLQRAALRSSDVRFAMMYLSKIMLTSDG